MDDLMGRTWIPYYDWDADVDMGCIVEYPRKIAEQREKDGGYSYSQGRAVLTTALMSRLFAAPGRRNDDAVNACIGLYVLGFNANDDPNDEMGIATWLRNHLASRCKMQTGQIVAFMDHVKRVLPYVEDWWRSGKFLDYAIKR